MDSLKASLEALPQELYDEILDWTFTPASSDLPSLGYYDVSIGTLWQPDFTPTSADRIIHAAYKPPKFLQISRETREKYAERYYGNGSIFYVGNTITKSALAAIPKKHVTLIREIRWLGFGGEGYFEKSLEHRWRKRMHGLHILVHDLPTEWLPIHTSIFKTSFPCADGITRWFSYFELRYAGLEEIRYFISLMEGTAGAERSTCRNDHVNS